MNQKVSEAKKDIEEKDEVKADDISTRYHIQVNTGKKKSSL